MNARIRFTSSLLVVSAAIAASPVARAQDAAAAATLAPPTPAQATGDTDHARMVGHLAVGFLGTTGVPMGTGQWICVGASTSDCVPQITGATQIDAPVIGVRYWLNDRFGIDAGIGIGILSGSSTSFPYAGEMNNDTVKWTQDKVSETAFAIHGGVPIALASGRHFTFEVIPELNVGFASGTEKDQNPPPVGNAKATPSRDDLKLGGFLLDVGARVGGEVQFGFMGLPELALQGTVGLFFSSRSVSASVSGRDASDSNTSIGTTVQSSPWGIFTNNISALYYF